jgi:flagellin-like protein
MTERRGISPVVSTVLMVAVVVVLASTISVFVFDLTERLNDGEQKRVFADLRVELGAEYRSWSGGGNASAPDIDHVHLRYQAGPVFESKEIGSILIQWDGDDGQGGQLRFVNPSRFNDETDQQYHNDDVGTICTGEIEAGGVLTAKLVHNRYQSGGATDPTDTNPETGEPFGERYTESGANGILVDEDPFFVVDGRYPVQFSGDRPMEPGDTVEVMFFGTEDELLIAKTVGEAREYTETPTESTGESC